MIEPIEDLYKKVNTRNQAKYLTDAVKHLDKFQAGQYRLSRRENYTVRSHKAADDSVREKYNHAKAGHPFRREEWICRLATGETFDFIGEVIDYQVPLKATSGGDDSGLGKIDLLTRTGDTVYLLEVKEPNNSESPLRAILEIYTYWRQLGGEDCRLFSRHAGAQGARKAKKALLLFENETQGSVYQKLFHPFHRDGHEHLLALMKELDVECFVGTLKDGEELVSVRPAAL